MSLEFKRAISELAMRTLVTLLLTSACFASVLPHAQGRSLSRDNDVAGDILNSVTLEKLLAELREDAKNVRDTAVFNPHRRQLHLNPSYDLLDYKELYEGEKDKSINNSELNNFNNDLFSMFHNPDPDDGYKRTKMALPIDGQLPWRGSWVEDENRLKKDRVRPVFRWG